MISPLDITLNLITLQLCPDIIFAATPPYDGTLCRYYRLPGDLAYPLPDTVSLEDGAMVCIRLLQISFDSYPLSRSNLSQ